MRTGIRAEVTLLVCIAAFSGSAGAQGCTQCRDSAQSTPPQTQAAYREAIFLLGGTGVLLSIVIAGVIWRNSSTGADS